MLLRPLSTVFNRRFILTNLPAISLILLGHTTQVTEKCVKKCAGTSGTTLDKREQGCMSLCMDRYIDTMTEVQKALMARQER